LHENLDVIVIADIALVAQAERQTAPFGCHAPVYP